MLSSIQIPESLQEGYAIYISLTEEQKSRLDNALLKSPAGLIPSELIDYLSQESKIEIEASDLYETIKTIFSIFSLKGDLGLSNSDLAVELVKALEDLGEERFKPTPDLEKHFTTILSAENIGITVKAYKLGTDREKLLESTKIITDFRPIFSDDGDIEIKAWMIVHNLKIGYYISGEVNEIYLALDSDDLKKLKENILRAEKKEELIRAKFESDHPIINLKSN
jgi:hypothetical protein